MVRGGGGALAAGGEREGAAHQVGTGRGRQRSHAHAPRLPALERHARAQRLAAAARQRARPAQPARLLPATQYFMLHTLYYVLILLQHDNN